MKNFNFQASSETKKEFKQLSSKNIGDLTRTRKNNQSIEYVLENGLHVILIENKFANYLTGIIAIKAGAKHDALNKNGIAHLIEHLVFKGNNSIGTIDLEKEQKHLNKIAILLKELQKENSGEFSFYLYNQLKQESIEAAKYANPNEYNDLLKQIGTIDINANTNFDRTIYHSNFPNNQIENWLNINSEIFKTPSFRSLIQELEIINEERSQDYQDPNTEIFDSVLKTCFKNLPFGQNTICGTQSTLNAPQISDLKQFYTKNYVANNMALVISGNFVTEEIKPLIEKTFGKLTKGEENKFELPLLTKINKREHHVLKNKNFTSCTLAFQTVGGQNKDSEKIELLEMLLSNTFQIGFLDQLELKNKIKDLKIINFTFAEVGCLAIQANTANWTHSLKGIERKILKVLDSIKKGDFSEDYFNIIKQKLVFNYQSLHENAQKSAFVYADFFAIGISAAEVDAYVERIKNISKEAIIKVCEKYFGENYISLHTRKGKLENKFELQTTEFSPINSKINGKSAFARFFETNNLKEKRTNSNFNIPIVKEIEIQNGIKLFACENTINDIFRLSFKYKIDDLNLKNIYLLENLINDYISKEKINWINKKQYKHFSCSITTYTDKNFFIIELTGFEKVLETSLNKLNTLFDKIRFSKKSVQEQIKQLNKKRLEEIYCLDTVVRAFHSKVCLFEESEYLKRKSIKDLKKTDIKEFEQSLAHILESELTIYYTGTREINELAELLKNELNYTFKTNKSDQSKEIVYPTQKMDKIYFLNNPVSSQTHIGIFAQIQGLDTSQRPIVEAFNSYFSDGFSGLVLQELRETRPLVYSASGTIQSNFDTKMSHFIGSAKTHSEKVLQTIESFVALIKKMPLLPERFKIISNSLRNAQNSKTPGFRDAPYVYHEWLKNKTTIENQNGIVKNYIEISFLEMIEFYNKYIQNAKLAICITGNINEIELERLKKTAPIQIVNSLDFFRI